MGYLMVDLLIEILRNTYWHQIDFSAHANWVVYGFIMYDHRHAIWI